MKSFKNFIDTLPSRIGVFGIGNFSPPTSEHQFMIHVVKKLAEQKKADHAIFIAEDAQLSMDRKLHYAKQFFPNTNFIAGDKVQKFAESYRKVIFVDGHLGPKPLFESSNVETFQLNNLQINSSSINKFASEGLIEEFMTKLPTTARIIDGRRLMNDLRENMGLSVLKTSIELPKDNLREQYFNKQIFNVGDVVESAGQHLQIAKRGTNYVICTAADGQTITKWIHEVQPVEVSKC